MIKVYNECVKKKLMDYIKKLELDKYPTIYIPNYIIKKFEAECEIE